jgi:CheY-like chemotaxis protein
MDGFQATAIIREREKETGDHVPIIAMTAHAMSGYREKCLAAGMDEYLSKPVRAVQLLEVLNKIVPRTLALTPATPAAAEPVLTHTVSVPHLPGGEVFDSAEACHQCLDNVSLLRRVVQSFMESLPSLKDDLTHALAKGDIAALARAAHTLKGATGSIVAQRSSRASLVVEQAAKVGDLAKARTAWENLSGELTTLEESIIEFMAEAPPANAGKPVITLQQRRHIHES